MYPTLPGANDPPPGPYAYGTNSIPSTPSYPAQGPGPSQLASAHSLDNNPWGRDSSSTLRVKIADEYKLAPPVQVPPALAASSKSQQEFDYEYERKVMSNDASTSFDAFLAKPETAYYDNTKANRFIRGGFGPAIVNMALAYHATARGDENQIMLFCDNLKTLTQDMSFPMALAAGALVSAKNDLSAAANLCTELS